MNERTVTIYVHFADPEEPVMRPVQAVDLGGGRYRITSPVPSNEEWKFNPGEVVEVEERAGREMGPFLLAVRRVEEQ